MRSVELFAGAGGLGLGVSRVGFQSVAVVERDRHACETLRLNRDAGHPSVSHWPLTQGDVTTFDYGEIGDADLVTGGPPCQPFSIGGKHGAYNDARDMFPEAVRAVRELRPRAFIFENVRGLTRTTFANYFEYIKLQLSYPELVRTEGETWSEHLTSLERHHTQAHHVGLEYRVVTRVLDAADYGVPQRRHRVFFVGFRSDLDVEWTFPESTHSREALIHAQDLTGEYWERHAVPTEERATDPRGRGGANGLFPLLSPWRTVRDAIADLPDPERDVAAWLVPNHRFQSGARAYVGHTGSLMDEPAKALKAGDHGVPGGENMLARADGSVRYFTVRESARLQTFPDDFAFQGTWSETMRQLGNAVPVTLAEIVAGSVKAHLEGRARRG